MIDIVRRRPITIEWVADRESWVRLRLALCVGAALALLAVALLPTLYAAGLLIGLGLTAMVMRYPMVGLVLIVISVPWGSVVALHGGNSPIGPTEVFVGEVGAAWLAVSVRDRRSPIPRTFWTPYVLLYLVAVGLSLTQAQDLRASAPEVLKWLEVAVVYFAGVRFINDQRALRWVAYALIASGVSEAVLGYTQFVFQLGPAAFGAHRAFFRSYGTFDQPNPYAGFLNMALPMAIAFALLGETRLVRRLSLLSTLLMAAALLSSQSRGGLLAGTIAAAAVPGVLSRRVRDLLKLVSFVAPVLALAAAYNLVPLGPVDKVLTAVGLGGVSFGNVNNANFSAVERAAHWLAGVRMFASHPLLGVGIGNYATAYPRYHPRGWYASLGHAHNYYINIAAEAGIVGLTAYVLLAGSALWYSCAAIRQVDSRLCRAVALGVLGALTATSIHNLFDVLYVHGMASLMGLLVALLPVCRMVDRAD